MTRQQQIDRLLNLEKVHKQTHKAVRPVRSKINLLVIKVLKDEKRRSCAEQQGSLI